MNERKEFLLHLYDQLWQSIMRIEQGLWQFIGIYAGIIGVHITIGKEQPHLAVYLIIILSFWGINIAINAGKWFERNRMMIINIEKEFIKEDLEKIMPISYHEKSFRRWFTTLDRIHMAIFTANIVVSLSVYWDSLLRPITNLVWFVILALVGLIGTILHLRVVWKELEEFVGRTK